MNELVKAVLDNQRMTAKVSCTCMILFAVVWAQNREIKAMRKDIRELRQEREGECVRNA